MGKNLTSNLAIIYLTATVDQELIEQMPMSLPFDVEEESLRLHLQENARKSAYKYDIYRSVTQVSLYMQSNEHYYHFLACPERGQEIPDIVMSNTDKRTIVLCLTEQQMLTSVSQMFAGFNTGVPVFAGWKIFTEVWPLLVNKFIRYNLPLYNWMAMDVGRRWNDVKNMFDLSNIYLQGVSPAVRALPSLGDALRFWGTGHKYPTSTEIRELLCVDPEKAAGSTEVYLNDMYWLLERYYNRPAE